MPQARGLPASPSFSTMGKREPMLENPEPSVSEDHLLLVPRGREGDAAEGTEVHGELLSFASPWEEQPQT